MHRRIPALRPSHRVALSLCAAAGLSVGFASCASDLWGRYIRDTPESCSNTPCAAGLVCNMNTGYCESTTDGGVDMESRDAASPTAFFATPVALSITPTIDTKLYYGLATVHPVDLLTSRDILLYGDQADYTRLHPTATALGPHTSAVTATTPQPCSVVQYPRSAAGLQDAIFGQLMNKTLRVSPSLAGSTPTVNGYKLVSVGDLNGDGIVDLVLVSSLSATAAVTYPSSGSDGSAQIFVGQADYTFRPAQLNGSLPSNLLSATAQIGTGAGDFQLGTIKDRNVATLISTSGDATTFRVMNALEVPIPTSDLAIPVDLDNDGDRDLVLVQLYDGSAKFSGAPGALHVAWNTGLSDPATFRGAANLVRLDTGGLSITSVKVDDFDKDGFYDVAVTVGSPMGGGVLLFRNETISSGSARRLPLNVLRLTADPPARAVEFVDLDGDGCKDMLMLFSGPSQAQPANRTLIQVARGKKNGSTSCP